MAFDYGDIPKDDADDLRRKARELRSRIKRQVEEVFGIGRDLIAAKRKLGPRFREWVECEVCRPLSTVTDWIQTTERFAGRTDIPFERITLAALYDLAREVVPEEAREAAIDKAKAGEHVGRPQAKAVVSQHRETPPPSQPPTPAVEPVPTRSGFYFASKGGLRLVVWVKTDGIPHLRAYIPGERRSYDLTAFTDYSDRLIDPRTR
jgi:hypothetical protein